jgi:hypothetical protein
VNEEAFKVEDLGDATLETRQQFPLGPFFDSYYGLGWVGG